jgi:hypothetical protein
MTAMDNLVEQSFLKMNGAKSMSKFLRMVHYNSLVIPLLNTQIALFAILQPILPHLMHRHRGKHIRVLEHLKRSQLVMLNHNSSMPILTSVFQLCAMYYMKLLLENVDYLHRLIKIIIRVLISNFSGMILHVELPILVNVCAKTNDAIKKSNPPLLLPQKPP